MIPAETRSLHLFAQQFWLEDWRAYAKHFARQAPQLCRLRITIRHSDWWFWENSDTLLLDPKQRGPALHSSHSEAWDAFDTESWGYQIRWFESLKIFELELETVEGKKAELDDIVSRAPGWHFPLKDGKLLGLNPCKTKKKGWHGEKLLSGYHVPSDPARAKQRLIEAGTDFTVPDGEPALESDDCLTYYVVTLVFEVR